LVSFAAMGSMEYSFETINPTYLPFPFTLSNPRVWVSLLQWLTRVPRWRR
jgi:hypothetical protein